MQSGKARARLWRLEFEPESAKTVEPLMGWTSARDTQAMVALEFESREDAVAYAARQGLDFELIEPAEPAPRPKAYAENFRFARKIPWSH
jgi:hypothetical protein